MNRKMNKKALIWDFLVDNLFWIIMLLTILIILGLLFSGKLMPELKDLLSKLRFF